MKITEEDIKKHKSYYLKCNYNMNNGYRYYITFNNRQYKRISKKLYDKISNTNINISQDGKFHIIAGNISII